MHAEGALCQFLEESYTHIENFEQGLLSLEKNYDKEEFIKAMYRSMHTIKGSAGFFNFKNLENVVHKTEDIFSYLVKIDSEKRIELIKKNYLVNLFFRVNDEIKKLLNQIKEKQQDQSASVESLISDLTNYNLEIFSNKEFSITLKNPSKKLNTLQLKAIENLRQGLKTEVEASYNSLSQEPANTELKLDDNIIIKQNTLESLSTLSAELIVTKNQMGAILNQELDYSSKLFSAFHRFGTLVTSLNERVTKIRLQPISKITDKLKRVVRDAGVNCGKDISFQIYGENIEIDRGILEVIKDPLIHILRNAIDHGIESPEDRIKNDKELVGNITIRAAYGENCVKLSITDDGRGIDLKKIISKALENNLISREQLKTIVRKDLLNLIFHPGFSTKNEITTLSGRGMGMSVVKESIAKVNGSIEINTADHYGTEFLIKLPVSLALRTAVIVEVEGQTYAVPSNFIRDINTINLTNVYGKDFLEIREEYYKVIYANEFLNVNNLCCLNNQDKEVPYLLIDTGDSKFLLLVDSILDLQDIIIKPFPDHLFNPGFFSGTTVLPDGRVALVFDLDELYDIENYENLSSSVANFFSYKATKSIPKKILTFFVGSYYCGINYDLVKEAVSERLTTVLPGTNVETVINLRGRILSCKKLGKLFSQVYTGIDPEIQIILELNKHQFAIQVDDLGEILDIKENMKLTHDYQKEMYPYVKQAYNLGSRTLLILKEDVCMKVF